jgi:putative transposase
METVLRYRYRAYPGTVENVALSRTFGSCRVVAHDAIAVRQHAYKHGLPYVSLGELSTRLVTAAKKTPERVWLGEVSAVALQQTLKDVDVAYRNFFSSRKGARKGPKMGPPKFRSRHARSQSARFTKNARFKIEDTAGRQARLFLPKIGWLPFVLSRPLPSNPTSVTVIRDADGRTYLSFVVTAVDVGEVGADRACGIDPGLSTYATILSVDTGTGEETPARIDTPMFLRRKARALARSQRSLSRKKKGSRNRAKAKVRVAVVHRKVRETRLDHAHQRAAEIVATHDFIAIETLSVAGMARTNLAKSVHDQAMAQFLRLIVEKAARQGRTVIKVGRFFPSTQTCSTCQAVTGPKGQAGLGVRHWTCTDCGLTHDRDLNAARNILTEGLRLLNLEPPSTVADGQSETSNACGVEVRPPETAAPDVEPGRSPRDQPCAA